MSSAYRSAPPPRRQKRHQAARHRRGSLLPILICAVVALPLGVVSAAGAILASGKMMAVSLDAAHPAPAYTQRPGVLLLALPDNPLPAPQMAALAGPAPETMPAEGRSALAAADLFLPPIVTPAARFEAPSAEPEITGAIADAAPAARVQLAAAGPVALPQDAAPLPRTRPQQFAALPPVMAPAVPENLAPARTAIYDLTAKTVYMPDGTRLEAHSGYGAMMDDPRHTRVKMRGATPPNIYTLREREALFHGVRAIRMTPVDEREMYGRDGILAHTYMLGPNGQSHGCVSIKDYPRFLSAFLRGEIDRMIVVVKMDKPPVYARQGVRSAARSDATKATN